MPDTMRAWLADDDHAPPTVEDLAREDDEDDYDLWGSRGLGVEA